MKSAHRNEDILCFGENIKKIVGEVRKYKIERVLSLKEKVNRIEVCIIESQSLYVLKNVIV